MVAEASMFCSILNIAFISCIHFFCDSFSPAVLYLRRIIVERHSRLFIALIQHEISFFLFLGNYFLEIWLDLSSMKNILLMLFYNYVMPCTDLQQNTPNTPNE